MFKLANAFYILNFLPNYNLLINHNQDLETNYYLKSNISNIK